MNINPTKRAPRCKDFITIWFSKSQFSSFLLCLINLNVISKQDTGNVLDDFNALRTWKKDPISPAMSMHLSTWFFNAVQDYRIIAWKGSTEHATGCFSCSLSFILIHSVPSSAANQHITLKIQIDYIGISPFFTQNPKSITSILSIAKKNYHRHCVLAERTKYLGPEFFKHYWAKIICNLTLLRQRISSLFGIYIVVKSEYI